MALKKWLLRLSVLSGILAFFIISGCSSENQNSISQKDSQLETIVKRGTLKIGMSTFVPWAMKDKNGELIGFEIDVAKQLAKDLGVKAQFIPTKWSGIIPALLTGKFDVIIGGMGIRPDRNLKVNFSIPYDYTGMSIIAHKVKAKGFSSLDDFNKKNVLIAARIGTTAAAAVKKFMPKASLKLFDDEAQAIQELLTGRVHAVIASSPMPAFQSIKHSETLFLPFKGNFTKEPIGFALRKGDYEIVNYFNSWIRVKDAQGWLAETKHYWFETKDWEKRVQ